MTTGPLAPQAATPDADLQPCSACGALFRCEAGKASACWCMALPALPKGLVAPERSCLCPACLQRCLSQTSRPASHRQP